MSVVISANMRVQSVCVRLRVPSETRTMQEKHTYLAGRVPNGEIDGAAARVETLLEVGGLTLRRGEEQERTRWGET
jgi:hypothetical protein